MKVLISLGPTREYIDPVRFISNASSGVTGASICRAFSDIGTDVFAVAGPVDRVLLKGLKYRSVVTSAQMRAAVHRALPSTDIFVSAAAVSDYSPVTVKKDKISSSSPFLAIKLKKTQDILSSVKSLNPNIFSVGFSLTTGNRASVIKAARIKQRAKFTDMIVANRPENIGATVKKAWVLTAGRCVPLSGPVELFAARLAKLIILEYEKKNKSGHQRRIRS